MKPPAHFKPGSRYYCRYLFHYMFYFTFYFMFYFILSIFTFSVFSPTSPLYGEFYFQGTDHQLEVIRLKGEKPGLTVLIFGGIHGDEPGGYFASEVLHDLKLLSGRVIVVPRVNYPSIMLNRRDVHGDMNRKFGPGQKPGDPDAEVVRILKNLMKEADILINQHDAFGFHRKTYISERYNPSRYGQSLIVDTASFYSKKLEKQVPIAEMGKRILERVNRQIKSKDHHFVFWDHDSISRSTRYPEMRKSATYYALTTHSIPAFGLETSKDLPTLSHKVKYQLLVIKEILREFNVEAVFPSSPFKLPVLHWVEFLKNGKDIVRVNSNTYLRLNPGDKIVLKKINANYNTGLSANILGWGNINDMDKEVIFDGLKTIRIKKNHMTMGRVFLKHFHARSVREVIVEINGRRMKIPNWGKIEVSKGRYFKIIGTAPHFPGIRFDVRGFPQVKGKPDDSDVKIYPRNLIKKYSFRKSREPPVYFVKIYNDKRFAGGFQVEIH
ncbi:MAG: hypothetical protein GY940_33150 [bacterium]|nr:hypothetical protein [bacterium]